LFALNYFFSFIIFIPVPSSLSPLLATPAPFSSIFILTRAHSLLPWSTHIQPPGNCLPKNALPGTDKSAASSFASGLEDPLSPSPVPSSTLQSPLESSLPTPTIIPLIAHHLRLPSFPPPPTFPSNSSTANPHEHLAHERLRGRRLHSPLFSPHTCQLSNRSSEEEA